MSGDGETVEGEGQAAEPALPEATRQQLLANPQLLLADRDLMRALVGAREAEAGANVVDIRGRAMQVLEERLDRLESAHRTVVATAYDNQSGMHQVHRAILSLLEPQDFPAFLDALQAEVAPILRIESLRLLIEHDDPAAQPAKKGLVFVPEGTVLQMVLAERRAPRGDDIVLRATADITRPLHDNAEGRIWSEALIPLNLDPDHGMALILMGSRDAQRFSPTQGTDLLRFFAQVFRLTLLRWLRP